MKQYWVYLCSLVMFVFTMVVLSTSLLVNDRKYSQSNEISERGFFYRIALSDFGNTNFIDNEIRLNELFESTESDEDASELQAFAVDLMEQREMSHDTLGGVFPLVRFLFKKIAFAPEELNPYEILDDIDVIAATTAVNKQLETIQNNWKAIPSFDVLITSNPANAALETEALYLFNSNSRFYVHNIHEKTAFLNKYELLETDLSTPRASIDVIKSLKDYFKSTHVIVVNLVRQNSPSHTRFYVADSKVINLEKQSSTSIRNVGFALDSSLEFRLALLLSASALSIGFLYLCLVGTVNYLSPQFFTAFGLYLTSFFLMLMTPSFAGPLLSSFIYIPSMEVLAISGWWALPLAVSVCMVAPSLIIYGVIERLKPSSVLKYIEANDIALLGIIQAIFCWMAFLYLVYSNATANYLVVTFILTAPLFLHNFWKNRLIGLELELTALYAVELCLLLVLISTANHTWILAGFITFLLVHVFIHIISRNFILSDNTPAGTPKSLSNDIILSPKIQKISDLMKSLIPPNVFILIAEDINFGRYIFDQISKTLIENQSVLIIDATDCNTDYSLVSKIVGRDIEIAGSRFDAALGVASDFIPFGSLISERASTSGVKDKHIEECGLSHFKAYYENSKCRHLIIENLSDHDKRSANWLISLLQKSWASELKIYVLTSNSEKTTFAPGAGSIKHNLELMDIAEARSFLSQFELMTDNIIELILDELSNDTQRFMLGDLEYFGRLAQVACERRDNVANFVLHDEIKGVLANSADQEIIDLIHEISEEPVLKLFLATAAYIGPNVNLNQISQLLDCEISATFRYVEEINSKHQVFVDPKSPNVNVVFRSSSFHKTCYQYFQFNLDLNQQSSFSQLVVIQSAKLILEENQISDARRCDLLNYLCAVGVGEKSWLLEQLLQDAKQMYFQRKTQMANDYSHKAKALLEKVHSKLSISEKTSIEVEIELLSLLCVLMSESISPAEQGRKVIKFLRRRGISPKADADVTYLMLRALYDARSDVPNALEMLREVCADLLQHQTELLPWLKAEIIHYQQLQLLAVGGWEMNESEKQLCFLALRDALDLLEVAADSPSELSSFSRIATTIISQDPYAKDVSVLADRVVEIKMRLFDFEGVAITKGAIARACFFHGLKYAEAGEIEDAREQFNNFFKKADAWKDASLETSAPDSVLLMIENFRAQAYLQLSRIETDTMMYANQAHDIVTGVIDMNINPETVDMSCFRQLASAYSILLELQLVDHKFSKKYDFDFTKEFYQRYEPLFEDFIKSKFKNLLEKSLLDWEISR